MLAWVLVLGLVMGITIAVAPNLVPQSLLRTPNYLFTLPTGTILGVPIPGSLALRLYLNLSGILIFAHNPLLGLGFDHTLNIITFAGNGVVIVNSPSHDSFISVAAQNGILAFLALLAFTAYLLVLAFSFNERDRPRESYLSILALQSAVLVIVVDSLATDFVFYDPRAMFILMAVVAAILDEGRRHRVTSKVHQPSRSAGDPRLDAGTVRCGAVTGIRVLESGGVRATITDLNQERRRVEIEPLDPSVLVPFTSCTTSLPTDVIERFLEQKGGNVCDELRRGEDPDYLEADLRVALLSYVPPDRLAGARILDFGSGAGASTMILARMFPSAEITTVELDPSLVDLSRLRLSSLGIVNVRFLVSPGPSRLPDGLGTFDYVTLCAVWEHMLPAEREVLLPQLWRTLRPRGALLLNQTPHRFSPVESHTTGLPGINYLPARLVRPIANRYGRQKGSRQPWQSLLRKGIRGGRVGEILCILRRADAGCPELLRPLARGRRDLVDVWYDASDRTGRSARKRVARAVFKGANAVFRTDFAPYLAIAIERSPGPSGTP